MGDRYFDYDPNEKCEECGEMGAYDIYGDRYCGKCITHFQEQAEFNTNSGPDGFFD